MLSEILKSYLTANAERVIIKKSNTNSHKLTIQSIVTGVGLLSIVILPSLGMVTLNASSQKSGLLLAIIIITSLAFTARIYIRRLIPSLQTIALIMMLVLLLGAYGYLKYEAFDLNRFFETYTYLLIVSFSVSIVAQIANRTPSHCANFSIKLVFFVVFSCIAATIFGFGNLVTLGEQFNKPSLFFLEPSHIAGAFSPCLLYLCAISSPRKKAAILALALASCICIENTTLLFSWIVVAALTLPFRQISLALCVAIPYLFFKSADFLYYTSRIDITNPTNESLVLYLSGWERTYLAFIDSYGLGIGFQQFGIIGSRGDILQGLDPALHEVTLLGGSSVAMKFIAEFGVFGLAAIMWYLFACAKIAIWLRRISLSNQKHSSATTIFLKSCFVLFFIDLFVRGTGYFTSTTFLFLVSALWISHSLTCCLSYTQRKIEKLCL